jgi:hypothetical protein
MYCVITQVDGGKLKEGLISVGSKRSVEPDPLDPEIIKRFDNKFSYRDVSSLLNTYGFGYVTDSISLR